MAIATKGYERFGLVANPFQELASEGIDDADLLHVDQEPDTFLKALKEEVVEKQRRATVVLLGALGTGKTQRLLVAQSEAVQLGIAHAFHQVSSDGDEAMRRLVRDIREAAKPFGGGFVTPKWLRELQALEKRVKRSYEPEDAGKTIATALNAMAPSFMLINDLQNLDGAKELDRFLQTLHSISNHLRPGVLMLMTCYPKTYVQMVRRQPQLDTRVDRRIILKPLGTDEATQMIAKRMPAKRIIDDLDPVYPFDREAIEVMAKACKGNPRELLRIADRVLEQAVDGRAFHIHKEDVVKALPNMTRPPSAPVVGTDPTSRKIDPEKLARLKALKAARAKAVAKNGAD